MNLYNVLNVNSNASYDEIKSSYKKLIKKYHPDKRNGDHKKYKEVITAYEILSDSKKREKYNMMNNKDRLGLYHLLSQVLKIFVCKQGSVSSIIEFFFNNHSSYVNSSNFADNFTKKPAECNEDLDIHQKLYFHLSETYNKKYYKMDYSTNKGRDNVIIPVVIGEYVFPNKGNWNGNKRGNLTVELTIVSDDDYSINGYDIVVNKKINLYEYLYGTDTYLRLPDDTQLKLNLKSYLHRSTVEVVRNYGLYWSDDTDEVNVSDLKLNRGDIYIKIVVDKIDTDDFKQFLSLKKKLNSIINED